MAKKKQEPADGVWVAELDRFGYLLTTIGHTEKEARDILMKEYRETYIRFNDGEKPEDNFSYDPDESDLQCAEECVYSQFYEYGKVLWH